MLLRNADGRTKMQQRINYLEGCGGGGGGGFGDTSGSGRPLGHIR